MTDKTKIKYMTETDIQTDADRQTDLKPIPKIDLVTGWIKT